MKSNKSDALEKNEYLNENKEDEVDHSQDSNFNIFFQCNNDDIFLKEIFPTFNFDEIILNHDLNNFQHTFYDPIYLWLEQSFLNHFPCHFHFFVNTELSLVFPNFGLFFLTGLKLLDWLH